MAESWKLRSLAGAACGPGDHELLSTAFGAAPATKAMDGTGDTWNRTETARTISAGNWTVTVDHDCAAGGGPQNQIRVQVHRRNGACIVQQTIIDEALNVNKGAAGETVTTTPVNPGAVVFSAGDILTVVILDEAGNQTKTVRYDGATLSTSDSRLEHPDAAIPDSRAEVSWFELEGPDVGPPPAQAIVTFAELEIPDVAVAARAIVAWAGLELPDPPAGATAPAPLVFVKPKSFNEALLLEELAIAGLVPDSLAFLGFTLEADGITLGPAGPLPVGDGTTADPGELRFQFSFPLSTGQLNSLNEVLDAHVATARTTSQAASEQDEDELDQIRYFYDQYANLSAAQKDEALRVALRLILRFHRGDELTETQDARAIVTFGELEVPLPPI